MVLDAAQFGASPTATPAANTASINAAMAAAVAIGEECRLPPGVLRHDGPLLWPGGVVRLSGMSAATVLTASRPGFTGLTVRGPGSPAGASGYVRDFAIAGASQTPTADGTAALRLDGIRQVAVDRVNVSGYDMGFDLVNNCYGSEFRNVRALFGTCNVGVNLRTGPQSGSDLAFYNCWLGGQVAGAHISGDGGGYHFHGGQLGCGQRGGTTDDLNRAAIIAGRDYLTGAPGSTSFDLWGVSFEGANHGWAIATWDQVRAVVAACSFNPTTPAIGLLRVTDPKNGRITLTDATLSGYWSGGKLVSVSGTMWAFAISERDTYTAAQAPTIAGASTYVTSVLAQSGLSTSGR